VTNILVVSASKRVKALPNVPTNSELELAGVFVESNHGLVASNRIPRCIVRKMRVTLTTTINSPAVKSQMASQGAIAISSSVEEYKRLTQQESAKRALVLKNG
jgi:tripartite-type tricarboxylate transporter receptor subunit TctC